MVKDTARYNMKRVVDDIESIRKHFHLKELNLLGHSTSGLVIGYNIETWDKDGNQYVIFPKGQTWIYYLYRPLTYIDSKVTTMHFHIGSHE